MSTNTSWWIDAEVLYGWNEKETSKGTEQASYAKEYCGKVEAEVQEICDRILKLLDDNLSSKASSGDSQGLLPKDEGRRLPRLAGFSADDAKTKPLKMSINITWCMPPLSLTMLPKTIQRYHLDHAAAARSLTMSAARASRHRRGVLPMA